MTKYTNLMLTGIGIEDNFHLSKLVTSKDDSAIQKFLVNFGTRIQEQIERNPQHKKALN